MPSRDELVQQPDLPGASVQRDTDKPSSKAATAIDGTTAPNEPVAMSPFELDTGTEVQRDADIAGSQLRSKGPCQAPGYNILEPLGAGTYGEVWLAEEARTGIQVAIKFFAHGAGQQWQLLQAEVKQLAQLHADPGIVHLIDVEPDSTPPYYIMAFAEQGSLAKRLERGPIPVDEALVIFRQVAEAMAYVHAKGIRHCDLKPGNILLDARGRVRVADFGQAHLSSDVTPALGTYFYMAPEQADLTNQIPDTRWDVYGLGALMYAMLIGRPPREDTTLRLELANTAELSHRLRRYRDSLQHAPALTAHHRVRGVDRCLAEVIDRCLAINPRKRLADANSVLAALDRRERRRRQRPMLLFGLVAPLLLLAIMAGGISLLYEDAKKETQILQQDIDKQTDERNTLVSELVADDIGRHLNMRAKQVEGAARHPGLLELMAKNDVEELTKLLKIWHGDSARSPIYAWITTKEGTIVAITPPPKTPLQPTSFQRREWFNGIKDYPEGTQAEPIKKTYISRPFDARNSGRMMIAVSTPIRNARNEVVGLISMTDDFKRWAAPIDDNQSFMVILNEHGEYMSHGDDKGEKTTPNQVAPQQPVYMEAIKKKTSGNIKEPFVDPLNNKCCVARIMCRGDVR